MLVFITGLDPVPPNIWHIFSAGQNVFSTALSFFQCIALLQGFGPCSRLLQLLLLQLFSNSLEALLTANAASQSVSFAFSSFTFCPSFASFCKSVWQSFNAFWWLLPLLPELVFPRSSLTSLTSLSIFRTLLAVSSLFLDEPKSDKQSASSTAAASLSTWASLFSSGSISWIASKPLPIFLLPVTLPGRTSAKADSASPSSGLRKLPAFLASIQDKASTLLLASISRPCLACLSL